MKTKATKKKELFPYFIHSDTGEVDSFLATSDEEAEHKMARNKSLPKNTQLELNRYDQATCSWHHVTSMMTLTANPIKK